MPDSSAAPASADTPHDTLAGWLRLGFWPALAAGSAVGGVLGAVLGAAAAQVAGGASPALGAGLGALCGAAVAPLGLVPALRLARRLHELQAEQTLRLPVMPLPPGWNDRRAFLETIDREWARCRRYDQDGALLLVDADHHAHILQQRGPACAEAVLVQCARLARNTLRHPDLMARFGDEGMAIFLPHTDPLGALDVAERIRAMVAAARLPWPGGDVVTTVSVGVAAIGASHASLDALIADAGRALHAAKDAGRNCVRSAPIQPRHPQSLSRPA